MSISKRRGTAFESQVVRFLNDYGYPFAERRALHGTQDKGDVTGVPLWTFECKATREIDLAGAVNEAYDESARAKTPWFAAIIKRRQRNVSEAYAVMPLWLLVKLMKELDK